MIGIIGAMKIEVEGIIKLMENTQQKSISGITFTCGELNGKKCVIAICGVGKVNAAICTQTMILEYSPRIIINTGVAGGIKPEIKIGDIVIATDVVQHDMDTSAIGDEKGFISGIDMIHIPCDKKTIENIMQLQSKIDKTKFHTGTIVTGDQFINNKDRLNDLMVQFNAVACEMEGGSIGQVCYINKVSFCVVRAISDNANDSSHIDYYEFVSIAANKSIRLICELVKII